MLKAIPAVLSPDLLAVLMAMGHGDEILLADGNFPASSRGPRVIRADGHGVATMLEAILSLLPLDSSVESPVVLMEVPEGERKRALGSLTEPPIWARYREILDASGEPGAITREAKAAFLERASRVFAIVATGEASLYANIILRKGVL
ncbi:MAG TPA: RbsD/FucU domain-containing protein [Rectinemataceae bacterium]|nr:RbsD/FucU domain-containing protein [Rectinemataceae bacterium]